MKRKIKLVVLIGLLLAASLVLFGCGGNCDGDCVIRANIYGERIEYKNCAGFMCDVSSHHMDNPYKTGHPAFANITCDCK